MTPYEPNTKRLNRCQLSQAEEQSVCSAPPVSIAATSRTRNGAMEHPAPATVRMPADSAIRKINRRRALDSRRNRAATRRAYRQPQRYPTRTAGIYVA